MPTGTFYRLPEEKRDRLIRAAWDEFTRNPFFEVSINRIIHAAGISRGSFYQYFSGKDDLFSYLLEEMRGHFMAIFSWALDEVKGDLFKMPRRMLDGVEQLRRDCDPFLERCIAIMEINSSMELPQLMSDKHCSMPRELYEKLDLSRLRRQDYAFVSEVFGMMLLIIGGAVLATLLRSESWQRELELLLLRLEILEKGSLSAQTDAGKGEGRP